jgi:hypothetical protein
MNRNRGKADARGKVQRPKMKNCLRVPAIVVCVLMAGCGGVRHEPSVIIVRNATGARLAEVTVSGEVADGRGDRVGSIAPVPVGAEQVFVRPANRVKMPDSLRVTWIDQEHAERSQALSIQEALNESKGTPDEALVIVIHADGPEALLEHVKQF